MGFNISAFKGQVQKGGFIQTNKYDTQITFSNTALSGSFITTNNNSINLQTMANDLSYRCISASLPGVAIRTSDTNRLGVGIIEKMPFSGSYTDITLTFLCDKNSAAYNFWYAWINYIFSVTGEENSGTISQLTTGRSFYTTEYKDNYASTIDITLYDNSGKPSILYSLKKAFPISINDSMISWSDNDNLLKLTTTITFREWTLNKYETLLTPALTTTAI